MTLWHPTFAIDVGAYCGHWTRHFKATHPDCHVLMVEPQASQADALQAVCDSLPGVTYCAELLGAETGKAVSFEEMKSGSSVFHERSPYPRRLTARKTITLDDVLWRADISRPVDFIKLDVQGYELEVLRGAVRTMRDVQVALIECSLIPVNRGAPLIHEMIGYMCGSGFRVLDIAGQTRRHDGALWQVDLVFAREDSGLLPVAELNEENWGSVKEVAAKVEHLEAVA
jgi:FkbM family methyltransferase